MSWFPSRENKKTKKKAPTIDRADKKDALISQYPEMSGLVETLYQDAEDGILPLADKMKPGDHVVFGKGDMYSNIMIIAEAPGLQECLSGDPLVGPSGDMINRLLSSVDKDMCRDTFVTNIVRIFPYKIKPNSYNQHRSPRQPTYHEISGHIEHLRRLICRIKPRLILTFGSISSNVLCNHLDMSKIKQYDDELNEVLKLDSVGGLQTKTHLAFIDGMDKGVWIQPMYHPAHFLYMEEGDKKTKKLHTWKESLIKGLESLKKTPPDTPVPMVLTAEDDGWDRTKNIERPWCKTLETTFFERPVAPDYSMVVGNSMKFQMNCFEYVHANNDFRLIGRNESGYSVCCTVVDNSFDFWIDIPACYNDRDINQDLLDTIHRDLTSRLYTINNFYEKISVHLSFEQHDNLYRYRNKHKPMPYVIKVNVQRHWHIKVCSTQLKSMYGTEDKELTTYGTDLNAELLFTYYSKIKASSWAIVDEGDFEVLSIRDRFNRSSGKTECDIEIKVSYKNIRPANMSKISPQRIAGFDIECINPGTFPRADRNAIICVAFHCQEQNDDTVIDKKGKCAQNVNYIFTMRKCAPLKNDRDRLFQFNNEVQLITAIRKFIIEYDPDKILGHNVKGFDFKYIIDRANYLKLSEEDGWGHIGRIRGLKPEIQMKKFKSRAYGESTQINIPMFGRELIDSYDVTRRTMKLADYKLQSISKCVLGDQKNDMPYVAIPGYFWGSEQDVLELNEYCVKDAALVVWIYNKKKWHYEMCEFARINGTVCENDIYVRGQQIKVFSCVMHNLIEKGQQYLIPSFERQNDGLEVVEEDWMRQDYKNDADTEDCDEEFEFSAKDRHEIAMNVVKEIQSDSNNVGRNIFDFFGNAIQKQKLRKKVRIFENNRKKNAVKKDIPGYQGATVLNPVLGLQTVPVSCLDFRSLYPSIMMWINICLSTVLYECQLKDAGFDPQSPEEHLNKVPIKFIHKGCNICEKKMVNAYFVKKEYMGTVFESDIPYYLWRTDDPYSELEYKDMQLHPLRWADHKFENQEDVEAHYERTYVFKDKSRYMAPLPQTLDMLLKARKAAKKERDKYPVGSAMYSVYDGRQLALKILANSIYGATGLDVGRLADKTIGASVTAWGRQEIEAARDRSLEYFSKGVWKELTERICKKDGRVDPITPLPGCVGGDTDSYFATYPFTKGIEDAIEFGYRCMDYQNKFMHDPMWLEFEKIMFLMMIVAKKRYAANLFAGENNNYIFEKKRWVELNLDASKWNEIFRTKDWQMPGVLYSEDEWNKIVWGEQKRRSAQTEVEWIADFEKPRYVNYDVFNPLDYGKFFSRGIETVRRDACGFLRITMEKYLKMFMMEGRPVDAIMYVYNRIKDLVNGRIPKEQLLMSKQISKEYYKKDNLPHLTVIKKMKKRGEHPPELGNRCPFFILKPRSHVIFDDPSNKGKKKIEKLEPIWMRSEHPNHVYKHDLDIDIEYYLKNQCEKPLRRMLSPVMDNVDEIMFNYSAMFEGTRNPSKIKVAAKESSNAITQYLTEYVTCEVCKDLFQKTENKGLLCNSCLTAKNIDVLRKTTEIKMEDVKEKYEEQMNSCRRCTNTYKADCNNFMCEEYAPRQILSRNVNELRDKLQNINLLPDIEDIGGVMKRKSTSSNPQEHSHIAKKHKTNNK